MRFARFRPPRRDGTSPGTESLRTAWRERGRWRMGAVWALPLLATVVLHQFAFPPSRSYERAELTVGEIADREIRAPFEFAAPRPTAEVERDRLEVSQRVEPVYRRDEAARTRTRQGLAEFRSRAGAMIEDRPELGRRVAELRARYPGLDERALARLLGSRSDLERVGAALDTVLSAQMRAGIVDVFPRGTYQKVWIRDRPGGAERQVPVTGLFPGYRLEEELAAALSPALGDSQDVRAGVALGRYFALPNLDYDEVETEARRRAAREAVPLQRTFARNERIVDRGTVVDRDQVAVLEVMEQQRFAQFAGGDRSVTVKIRAGRALLTLLVLIGALTMVRQVDPDLVLEPNRYLLLGLLWIGFLGASAFVLGSSSWGGAAAVPVTLLAMLAVVVFGESTANRVATAGLLLLVVVPEHASPMVLAWMAIAAVSIRMLRRVRNRNQFYRALGVVSATAFLAVASVALAGASSVGEAAALGVRAVASAAVGTAVSLFLLPILEAAFGVTTELTLLELSDLNHPLIRRMSLESPGTFHHSQVVGMLAEAGARAIHANSLLTRVGANFHDIGKMLKPRYFAENQGMGNPHDELTPQMSALVIASHVKEGIELGRQWGLPPAVLAFIPEHHGTSVMQFFYKKALERDDGRTVKVDDFRYPGPRPRSRETAILMLADGCEASVRSLRRPTPSRIREMVRKIFDAKMAEGELEECGLTLRELARVREAFIPTLVSIHHQRVAYPGQREHEAKKENESREARARARRGGPSVVAGS